MSQPDPSWDRLKELFAAASPLPTSEREAFLRARGAGDGTVREVLELLGQGPSLDERPGDTIGPYKLLECLGEGGFGTVWMAEQRTPIQRLVALKLLKAGMDSAQVLARFEQERQALALMQHPNIAQVYDAGTTPRGRPFFAMELVKGVPITDYATRERLTIEQRLEVFVQVCRAVQHAHQKGVIHRDIKPRNVLVVTADGRPLAKVIDFGIAKATAGRLTERTLFTEHRAMVGTLEYMSPEQAEGLLDVDTRADVYSLGALLYELLTGGTPFDAGRLLAAGFGEMLRVLREVEPEKPSVRVSSKAGASWIAGGSLGERDPKRLFGSLRGDLDWVVMKALEKDRARRYGSAEGLAADVGRYLAGEAVEAVPPSFGYRVRKFVRRHRGATVGLVSAVAAFAFGWTAIRFGFETADQRLGRLEQVVREQTGDDAQIQTVRQHSDDRFEFALGILEGNLFALSGRVRDQLASAELLLHSARISNALALSRDRLSHLAKQQLAACPESLRGFEWRFASVQVAETASWLATPIPISWCLADDGMHLLCIRGAPSRLLVIDCRTRTQIACHPLPIETPTGVKPLQGGAMVDGQNADGEPLRTCVEWSTGAMHAVAPADEWFAAGSNRYVTVRGNDVRVHEIASGAVVQQFLVDREPGATVQVLPQGRWMLVSQRRASTELSHGNFHQSAAPGSLIDLTTPTRTLPVPGECWINPQSPLHVGKGNWYFDEGTEEVHRDAWPEPILDVLTYPTGQHVLAEVRGNVFRVVEIRGGRATSPELPIGSAVDGRWFHGIPRHGHRCFSGFMSLDPLAIETGEWLGPEPGRPDMSAECTDDGLHWIVNQPSGLEIATARPPQIAPPNAPDPILALAVSPHRSGLGIRATTKAQEVVFVADTGVPHRQEHSQPIQRAVSSGNGQVLLRRSEDGRWTRLDAASATATEVELADVECRALAIDHMGANLAFVVGDRLMHADLTTGRRPVDRGPIAMAESTPALAVAGNTIAIGQSDGFVVVLADRDKPAANTTWRHAEAAVCHMTWSPDGTMLLIATADGSASLLRSKDLSCIANLQGHLAVIQGSAWSPDGRRVFTCSNDGTVRCWQTTTPPLDTALQPLLTLTEPEVSGRPTTLLMTPDGERLACGYDDGSIRVWDSVPWTERVKHVPSLFPSTPK